MNTWTIHQATLEELGLLLALADGEGWNPGLGDALPFYSTDPKGFFIGRIDGKMVGCISAVAYGATYGFLGFYIVLPEYRGKGYGLRLWNHAISYLGDRTIGLDGVVAQQENYKKSGFKFSYNNIRFTGKVKGSLHDDLLPIDQVPFEDVVAFDTPIFGVNRSGFLQHWLHSPTCWGFAKKREGKLLGYGCIRQCRKGYKIGPLYAQDAATAREIFLALATKSDEADIFFDVPEPNSDAKQLAHACNLRSTFATARMYKGTPPKQELKKVFGVSTFELG